MVPIATLSPRQAFEDNLRPAVLLLRVYRLLALDELVAARVAEMEAMILA